MSAFEISGVGGGGGTLAITEDKTTPYTASYSDDVIQLSDAVGHTSITLPTAVGHTGKEFWIVKTTPLSNSFVAWVATTSGQTISGMSGFQLHGRGEVLHVISDGANWLRIGGNSGVFHNSRDIWVGGNQGDGDGRTPETCFNTFAEAFTAIQASGGGTIHLCSVIVEACVVTTACNIDGHGFSIIAPSAAANCLTISGQAESGKSGLIRNLKTLGNGSYTGTGIYMDGAANWKIENWTHDSGVTPTQTIGGNGLFTTFGESNHFSRCTISRANASLNLAEESSTATFVDVTSSGHYRCIYFNGQFTKGGAANAGCGACTFIRFKATAGVNSWVNSDYSFFMEVKAVGGDPGNHVFIHGDWSEDAQEVRGLLDGAGNNVFVQSHGSPQMKFEVPSNDNSFINFGVLNALTISGRGNHVDTPLLAGGHLTLSGTRNRLSGQNLISEWQSQITVGTGNYVEQTKMVVALTYSATIAVDPNNGHYFTINATNGTAFTISNPGTFGFFPPEGWEITFDLKNSSGGAMGAITWGSNYLLAGAFTNPANGKRRTIQFLSDGTSLVEQTRAGGDI